ncbi:xanthan lyase [Dysgonomonas sp. 520]|uniref:golvesin C-terminal-like domain-containing protein n=1 Tax=Dysgonomonas sp. 520 TaxID=2302931 RepID=UPI0013D3D0CD|nr:xanthan lyase [Dysgonomonas sp. 520]NDW08968.1 xanthan lyase [Dysgonomonas sp. 520]
MKKVNIGLILIFCLLSSVYTFGQGSVDKKYTESVGNYLTKYAQKSLAIGKIKIESAKIEKKTIRLYANDNCAYIPFREENVKEIYAQLKVLLPKNMKDYSVKLYANKRLIEDYIPLKNKNGRFENKVDKPLVTNISRSFVPEKGLDNRHIAMWQSHGWYYEQKLARWEWQRARMFQTVEDLYTQSYVLPFLVPMLENAGANVLLPRERDYQLNEVIVDNDRNKGNSKYKERGKNWKTGKEQGFAYLKEQYEDFENPFNDGTYRQIETVTDADKESWTEWMPELPEAGEYGVYVSYKTLPKSTDDALYTVHHKGGQTRFRVNQKMGGGTWIYLGKFSFEKGISDDCKITLSNLSAEENRILTADAVKIGGGYGNIARKPSREVLENKKSSDKSDTIQNIVIPEIDYQAEISRYPRFTEASRYWLQWAGFPDSVYSLNEGKNDYMDDYQSRPLWVNYISGGSSVAPKTQGLNIPVDMSFAFHSDAGTTMNDSIIGTLGIYCTAKNNEKFENGSSRYLSHDLTDIVQTQIVDDIRKMYEPNWSRRGKWNKSYYEARVPEVPAMLLELLSHQNFADMKYGLDPRFRFTVSRSVYKGILRFLSAQYGQEYVVQPLPVSDFQIEFVSDDEVELKWKPVEDPLEFTAKARKYMVYTRLGDGGFDNGVLVDSPSFRNRQQKDIQYSYMVAAVNDGGESFPSEILSAYKSSVDRGTVLIVNGFERISAPAGFEGDSIAGFSDMLDHGVPYKEDISYIGSQYEYRRTVPWMDDDAPGFGASNANYETMVVAGNSFDYPYLHGKSISKLGYSYTSCSSKSVMSGAVDMNSYKVVDLILGKQKQTLMGRGVKPAEFKTFPKKLQKKITDYCKQGGNIFVSGAFVGTDLWDNVKPQKTDQNFAQDVLKYKWRVGQASVTGEVKSVTSPFEIKGDYTFYNRPNPKNYVVESPDGIEPVGNNAFTIFRYSENNISAGIAFKGKYKTCVLGFPFESLKSETERDALMQHILIFLLSGN